MLMSRRTTFAFFAVALSVVSTAWLSGQAGSTFQFIVAATNSKGEPVADLKPEDVIMTEKAGKATVTKLEPFALPVKVTIAVDNGSDVDAKGNSVPTSALAISNYRNGLKGFVEAFPADTEMTIITTSPQPRMVVKESKDRAVILRGVNGFSPEMERPRFTDTIVEYSRRLENEIKDQKVKLYVPILMMVSTAANETVSYQPGEVQKAVNFLVQRRAMIYVTVNSTRSGEATATADLNTNRQAIIAIPATKAVNGRYESIAIFNRLDTLLPEMGKELAAYARRLSTQYVVTVQRAGSGPIEGLGIELAREGLTGAVSPDGYIPR
jgi:hypothetical protein